MRFKCRHCQALNLRTTSRCSHCHQLLRFGDWDFSLPKLQFRGWRWHREWLKRAFLGWVRVGLLLLIAAVFVWLLTSMLWISGPRR